MAELVHSLAAACLHELELLELGVLLLQKLFYREFGLIVGLNRDVTRHSQSHDLVALFLLVVQKLGEERTVATVFQRLNKPISL